MHHRRYLLSLSHSERSTTPIPADDSHPRSKLTLHGRAASFPSAQNTIPASDFRSFITTQEGSVNRVELNPDWPWSRDFRISQGVRVGETVYVSGQGPIAADGRLVGAAAMLPPG